MTYATFYTDERPTASAFLPLSLRYLQGPFRLDHPTPEISVIIQEGSGETFSPLLTQNRALSQDEMRSIFENFVTKFLSQAKPLEREYAEVVNKHFWDLLM